MMQCLEKLPYQTVHLKTVHYEEMCYPYRRTSDWYLDYRFKFIPFFLTFMNVTISDIFHINFIFFYCLIQQWFCISHDLFQLSPVNHIHLNMTLWNRKNCLYWLKDQENKHITVFSFISAWTTCTLTQQYSQLFIKLSWGLVLIQNLNLLFS